MAAMTTGLRPGGGGGRRFFEAQPYVPYDVDASPQQGTDEWLREREGRITGSKAACLATCHLYGGTDLLAAVRSVAGYPAPEVSLRLQKIFDMGHKCEAWLKAGLLRPLNVHDLGVWPRNPAVLGTGTDAMRHYIGLATSTDGVFRVPTRDTWQRDVPAHWHPLLEMLGERTLVNVEVKGHLHKYMRKVKQERGLGYVAQMHQQMMCLDPHEVAATLKLGDIAAAPDDHVLRHTLFVSAHVPGLPNVFPSRRERYAAHARVFIVAYSDNYARVLEELMWRMAHVGWCYDYPLDQRRVAAKALVRDIFSSCGMSADVIDIACSRLGGTAETYLPARLPHDDVKVVHYGDFVWTHDHMAPPQFEPSPCVAARMNASL